MSDFQQRLNAYLKLREELSRRLKPLSTTAECRRTLGAPGVARRRHPDGAERSETGRPGRRPPRGADHQDLCGRFHFRNPQVKRAALQEVPNAPRPAINRTYPENEALPTVPPLLLSKLPQLPDNLQYRFFGRHIVILDGDTQIIIDYVANALPPH